MDRKMNLVFFIGALGRGGMERQMCILMDELVRRGHNIRLITFLPLEDAYQYDQRIKRLKFDGKSKFSTFINLFRFFHSKKGKCDAIVAFGRLSSEVGILANLFHNYKIIVGERNYTEDFTIRDRFIFSLFRYTDGIVTNCHAQQVLIAKEYPQYKSKLSCIINYTDTSSFSPKQQIVYNDDFTIGVFARLHPQKNCLRFIEAISKLRHEYGSNKIKIKWFGATSSGIERAYKIEVEQSVKRHSLEDIFMLLPATDKVRDEICGCDAICLPSIFEGFSNSVSEAISCGKIVLASDVSDNHVMVENGVNGYLFDPLDVDSMCHAIARCLSLTADDRKLMEERSRQKALELFNLKKFGDEYENIINEVVNELL